MKKVLFVLAGLLALGVYSSADSIEDEAPVSEFDAMDLSMQINEADAYAHLEKLMEIGQANNNTRAAGTPGYKASVQYIVGQLMDAGYDVQLQAFDFDKFIELEPSVFGQVSPEEIIYEEEKDFNTMSYSPSGDVSAEAVAVDVELGPDNKSTSGCEPEDFAGFPAGKIALVQRGTCTFVQKALNADEAGASAVLIFNQGNDEGRKDVLNGTLGKNKLRIPVFGLSYDLGVELMNKKAVVSVKALTKAETQKTYNVLAETKKGNADNVVMVGAHLDSVDAGPGINDNGSGSAAILTVALAMKDVTPVNKVRFAWWGAEEHGLVGSRYYTAGLSEEDAAKIALYLNFDMVASPNYIFGIYDADGSQFEVPGPKGSAAIEKLFHDFFSVRGLKTIEVEANGRSDYVGFAEKGIPFGGSFTGAEKAKTEEEALLFGGVAGESYDVCYHKDCDSMSNVNRQALESNLQMIMYSTLSYARSTEDIDAEKNAQEILSLFGDKPVFDPTVYPEHYECHEHAVWAK